MNQQEGYWLILAQTIEQLERMNRVLAHLREDVRPLEEISRLKEQIEAQTQALVA